MIGYLLHKHKLRKIKREIELRQVECNHIWRYFGAKDHYYDAGCDVGYEELYVIKCTVCGIEKSFEDKRVALSYENFSKGEF